MLHFVFAKNNLRTRKKKKEKGKKDEAHKRKFQLPNDRLPKKSFKCSISTSKKEKEKV